VAEKEEVCAHREAGKTTGTKEKDPIKSAVVTRTVTALAATHHKGEKAMEGAGGVKEQSAVVCL